MLTVDVLGYPNAKGFIYAQGASLNKDSTGLSVGEKGKTYYLMIDSDSATPGVNPLPSGYSVEGLYLNEELPAGGSYSVSNKFTTGTNQWTEGGESYGGTTYQFTMPEETANITAVFSGNTSINANGLLTIGADETATSITVKASAETYLYHEPSICRS